MPPSLFLANYKDFFCYHYQVMVEVACQQALHMGYSEICFRIGEREESLQWSLYDLSIYIADWPIRLDTCQISGT